MNDRNLAASSSLAEIDAVHSSQLDATVRIFNQLLGNLPGATVLRTVGDELNLIEVVTPKFTLPLRDMSVLRKLVFNHSSLLLADTYIDGLIDVQGDLYVALGLKQYFQDFDFSLGKRWALVRNAFRLPSKPREFTLGQFAVGGFRHQHSRNSDKEAISFHYDVSNDFYRLWLDEQRGYSCAYFEMPDDTLKKKRRTACWI